MDRQEMKCNNCDKRVVVSVVSTKQIKKNRRAASLGRRVRVRLGLACDCTAYRKHSFTYDGLDKGYFDEKPEKFPDCWID